MPPLSELILALKPQLLIRVRGAAWSDPTLTLTGEWVGVAVSCMAMAVTPRRQIIGSALYDKLLADQKKARGSA